MRLAHSVCGFDATSEFPIVGDIQKLATYAADPRVYARSAPRCIKRSMRLRVSVSRNFVSLIIQFNMKHNRFFNPSVLLLLAFADSDSGDVNVRALTTPTSEGAS